ncbi:collagen alpha-3(VI) chain-like protein [Corchorus olitorius]|uniref:Collagen alpha-3(VI) chain-like protein n=1 Tax=Corchorus olitorius TaxID=93759 RepID=A0A1R3K7I2_9ROSI|nr:collagen alpha-3(VI) chain-like protein [Corchorus olitorius]
MTPLCGQSLTLCGPMYKKQANGCLGLKVGALDVDGVESLLFCRLSTPPLELFPTFAGLPPLKELFPPLLDGRYELSWAINNIAPFFLYEK